MLPYLDGVFEPIGFLNKGGFYVGVIWLQVVGHGHGKHDAYSGFEGCEGAAMCGAEVDIGNHAVASEGLSCFAIEKHSCW